MRSNMLGGRSLVFSMIDVVNIINPFAGDFKISYNDLNFLTRSNYFELDKISLW